MYGIGCARSRSWPILRHYLNMYLVGHRPQSFSVADPTTQITYLLTEFSPSRGAANCAATQELPSNLWNPKLQYRVHKSPPLVPILSHISPIHTIQTYLSKHPF
jgi:hypothetical protein